MKFTAKRLFGAGVIGIAAIVAPISLTVLSSGPGSIASAQPVSCTPVAGDTDAVCYVQSSAASNTYQYDTGAPPDPAPQPVTVSAHCATTSGDALLTMCGWDYQTATPPTATVPPTSPVPAAQSSTVGTSSGETGVCAVSPCNSLENKTSGNKSVTDALDFSPGPAQVVAGRPFNDAQIQIQRKDNGVTSIPSVNVQLAELDSNRDVLATQDCTLSGGTGATITADTGGAGVGTDPAHPANCHPSSGTQPSSFSTVEVRDNTNSTALYVVGTSTFSLANQQCFGQTPLQPAGNPIVAPLSITQPGMCKTYSSYTYADDPNSGVQQLNFQATSANPVPFSINVIWNPIPECQPTPNNSDPQYSPPLPVCPVTEFTLNNTTYYDQLFCPAPVRTDPATLNGSPTVMDSSITAADQGRGVSGSGIPANSYVGTVTPGMNFLLSSSPTKQVNVSANTSGQSDLTLAGVAFPQRTDTATVTSGSDSVADTSITALDQGEQVSGPGIPDNTYVGTVTPGVSFLLSSSPTSQVNVNANGNGVLVNVGVPACVTSKTYTNITVNGTPETVVNEQWSLLADFGSRFR